MQFIVFYFALLIVKSYQTNFIQSIWKTDCKFKIYNDKKYKIVAKNYSNRKEIFPQKNKQSYSEIWLLLHKLSAVFRILLMMVKIRLNDTYLYCQHPVRCEFWLTVKVTLEFMYHNLFCNQVQFSEH